MLRKVIFNTSEALRKIGVNFNNGRHQGILDMQKSIKQVGGINFKLEFYPDGSWTAESTNVEGVITGGKDVKGMNMVIKDAIFTYFDVPPHLCNDKLLNASNEPVSMEQRVWVTK